MGAAIMALTAEVFAANEPVWTFNVPVPSFATASSSVTFVAAGPAGEGLLAVGHIGPFNGMFSPEAGTQLFLLNAKGKLLAKGEIPPSSGTNLTITPLRITPSKVVVKVGGELREGTIDKSDPNNPTLVFVPVPVANAEEVVLTPTGATDFDRKFINTFVNNGTNVTQIRRYALSKLRP